MPEGADGDRLAHVGRVIAVQLGRTDSVPLSIVKISNLRLPVVIIIMVQITVKFSEVLIITLLLFQALYVDTS